MSWSAWRSHFERSASRPCPATGDPGPVPAPWRAELARSLAKFQVGEAGGGRIANEVWHARIDGIDDDYRAALGLFVREEARHGRILAGLVTSLGGTLLEWTWTERLFVFGRRLLGIRAKLLVLLAAEVIGIVFYGLLADALPAGGGRLALLEMSGDERHHLRFHVDFFRRQTATWPRRLVFLASWWLVGGAAALAVLVDHRRALRLVGAGLPQTARRFARLLASVAVRAGGEAMISPRRPSSAPAAS